MAQWKFQILPNERNIIGVGYRMDIISERFENKVNDALRYPFRFHKINKLVLKLGPSNVGSPDYYESPLGVAYKQVPEFSAKAYLKLSDEYKERQLQKITLESFYWILNNFDDAEFVNKGLINLGWPIPEL